MLGSFIRTKKKKKIEGKWTLLPLLDIAAQWREEDEREPKSLVSAEFSNQRLMHSEVIWLFGEQKHSCCQTCFAGGDQTKQPPLWMRIYLSWLRHKCPRTRWCFNFIAVRVSVAIEYSCLEYTYGFREVLERFGTMSAHNSTKYQQSCRPSTF